MNINNYDLDRAWQVKAIIEKEYCNPVTVSELAQMAGTNKSTLNFAFRSITGMSIKQYLTWFRMEKAKEMLAFTKYTIDYIAKKVGLTRRTFEKQFKRMAEMTPREWRSRYAGGGQDSSDKRFRPF